MDNLFKIYSGIYDCPCLWKYYASIKSEPCLEVSPSFANQFFTAFFKAGEKKDIPKVTKLDDLRLCHTLSAYFLGLYLFEHFHFKNPFEKQHYPRDFRYFWFLLCLCHDVGYTKENKILLEKDKISQPSNMGIIEKRFDEVFKHCTIPKSLADTVKFSPTLIENYNKYIQNSLNKREHGTEGAIDFFNGVISHHSDLKHPAWRVPNGQSFSLYFRARCFERACSTDNCLRLRKSCSAYHASPNRSLTSYEAV